MATPGNFIETPGKSPGIWILNLAGHPEIESRENPKARRVTKVGKSENNFCFLFPIKAPY